MRAALGVATATLLAELTAAGHWAGELSSSALSTATAVVALAQVGREADGGLIRGGLRWLAQNQNADGGWGDTVKSKSNISTTALCWAAYGAARADGDFPEVVARARRCLEGVAHAPSRAVFGALAETRDGAAPAAVGVLILRQPAQPPANQVPIGLAPHLGQRHHRRRRRKRAARKLALPMSMRPHFRQQRLRRLHQSRPQSLR